MSKRRKRKRKHKQESQPTAPATIQGGTELPPAQISIQDDREQATEKVSYQHYTEQLTEKVSTQSYAEQSYTEQTSSAVEIFELQVEVESTISRDGVQSAADNPATHSGTGESSEVPASPVVTSAVIEEIPPESPAPTGADRRSHPRYAFTAPVEVVAAERGARLKTRVRDLSQQGCYVDTDNPLALGTATDVRITKGAKSFEALARVVYNQPGKGMGLMFTSIDPRHHETLEIWIAESRETSWLAANRRRSQRVLMRIPVQVSGRIGTGWSFEEETTTLAISAHGAMLLVDAPVYRGQSFMMVNTQTKASLECVVVHIDKSHGEHTHVGVEFLLPNPTFWRVAFPPKDWTPRHPDAKSG